MKKKTKDRTVLVEHPLNLERHVPFEDPASAQKFWRGEDGGKAPNPEKTVADDVMDAAKLASIPKLSGVKREPRYCKCQRCRLIFENDVETMHAPCPKCGAVMENISQKAAENLKEQWDQRKKEVTSHA